MPLRHVLQRPFRHDGGNAFTAALPTAIVEKASSGTHLLALLEDGQELGPAASLHDTIRAAGAGAFCQWNEAIWFSSSDNANCETNGRQYELWLFDTSKGSALYNNVAAKIAESEAAFLELARANTNRNNSMLSTFFGARATIRTYVKRFGVDVPSAVLELGCGRVPWIGLRFLLEGTQRYVANDIMEVRKTFPADEIRNLRSFCAMVEPDLLRHWSEILGDGQNEVAPPGLDVRDGASFDTLDLDESFDLAISTSVLEHVQDPAAVYTKLAAVTRPDGLMFHSIDLRDHRSFETDPLAFLKESDEQYAPINTENRLRASDHRTLINRSGFEILHEQVYVLDASGAAGWTEDPSDATLYVTPLVRDTMHPRFKHYDLLDLSTLAILVVCRRS